MRRSVARRSSFRQVNSCAIAAARTGDSVINSSSASRACPSRPHAFIRGASRNPTSSELIRSPARPDASMSARNPTKGVSLIRDSPNRAIARFSSSSGTTSAIVPSATYASRSIRSCRTGSLTRSEPAAKVVSLHASLYATPAPHSAANGYCESGLPGCTTAYAQGNSSIVAGGV